MQIFLVGAGKGAANAAARRRMMQFTGGDAGKRVYSDMQRRCRRWQKRSRWWLKRKLFRSYAREKGAVRVPWISERPRAPSPTNTALALPPAIRTLHSVVAERAWGKGVDKDSV